MPTMTKDDILKHLHTHLGEELKDAEKYCDMADSADKMGRADLVEGLSEMAHDEYTHAKFIVMVLEDEGATPTEEECEKMKALETRMEHLFR